MEQKSAKDAEKEKERKLRLMGRNASKILEKLEKPNDGLEALMRKPMWQHVPQGPKEKLEKIHEKWQQVIDLANLASTSDEYIDVLDPKDRCNASCLTTSGIIRCSTSSGCCSVLGLSTGRVCLERCVTR